MQEWIVHYGIDGRRWTMSVVASDADDAKRRLAAAAQWGTVEGALVARLPMWRGGFFLPLIAWVRNVAKCNRT
mgnify:CR=1 FL=1